MSNYTLTWNAGSKIVILRVTGFVPDAEAEVMAAELLRMANMARREAGFLRVLFDNSKGAVFPPKAAEALAFLKTILSPADRNAVLVAGSLNRLQADRNRSANTRLFDTETDAMAWLTERI